MGTNESRRPAGFKPQKQADRRLLGYARVSTGQQNLSVQRAQLEAAGVDGIYAETISGRTAQRPQLKRLLRALRPGDVVLVGRLDRLARSTRDLLNILAAIEAKRACFRSLSDPWADTTTPHGRLLVCVLGGLAEFERELIRARTAEGRALARKRGRHMGRPAKLSPAERAEVRRLLAAGTVNRSELGRRFHVSRTTIGRQSCGNELIGAKLIIPGQPAGQNDGCVQTAPSSPSDALPAR